MGRHKVNIASMSLSRDTAGGRALTVLNLDSAPSRGGFEGTWKRILTSAMSGWCNCKWLL